MKRKRYQEKTKKHLVGILASREQFLNYVSTLLCLYLCRFRAVKEVNVCHTDYL
jgi:hypothetical protein